MVIGEGFTLAAIGATIGIAGALALGRFIRSLLFGVEPADPLTLGAVVVTLLLVAVVECAQPARRATRLNPVDVLRTD